MYVWTEIIRACCVLPRNTGKVELVVTHSLLAGHCWDHDAEQSGNYIACSTLLLSVRVMSILT